MRRVLLTLFVALLLVFAGCVGDDPTGSNTSPETDDGTQSALEDSENNTSTGEGSASENQTESNEENETEPTDSGEGGTGDDGLEIHHIDVGQGDSALVITPSSETMLIDSGDWRQDGADVIEYLQRHDVDRIDHLVATHGHADHIGGHAAVIEYFEMNGDGIGAVYDSGIPHTSQTYENYLDAIDEYDVELFQVAAGDALAVGDADVQFFNPLEEAEEDDVDGNGLVFTIDYGETTYLTTGDIEADVEDRLVTEYGNELDADVYQAGHHGSSTSSSQPFMDTVEPEITIISSAYESQYGHPHDEVLERFDAMGLETYWTGVHGDVVVTIDGETVSVEPAESFSSDPADLLEEKPPDEASELIAAPENNDVAGPVPG